MPKGSKVAIVVVFALFTLPLIMWVFLYNFE